MATISPTKSGKYKARITVKEGAKTKQIQQTFNTKKEALKFARLSNNVDLSSVKEIELKEKQARVKRRAKQLEREKTMAKNPLNFVNYFLNWYRAYKEPRGYRNVRKQHISELIKRFRYILRLLQ